MSRREAGRRPLQPIRPFAVPLNLASSTHLLSALRMQSPWLRLRKERRMTGLSELFLGLMIIGSVTGLIVGVATFLARKERGTQVAGKL